MNLRRGKAGYGRAYYQFGNGPRHFYTVGNRRSRMMAKDKALEEVGISAAGIMRKQFPIRRPMRKPMRVRGSHLLSY